MLRILTALLLVVSLPASAASPMLVDAAGHAIGYYVGSAGCASAGDFSVYSRQNYLACFEPAGTMASSVVVPSQPVATSGIYYVSIDCTGQTYANTMESTTGGFAFLAATSGAASIYIVPPGASSFAYYNSYWDGGTCLEFPPGNQAWLTPIEPNVPELSGFSRVPYIAPLSIQVLPDSALDDVIFFDTFQSY